MLQRVVSRRTATASLLSEMLAQFGEHRSRGLSSRWTQETQYEYRLNADGKSATVGGSIHGKDKNAEYLGVFGGEVDERGHFKTGGIKKYFKDATGQEKVQVKGDHDPQEFLQKLGIDLPQQMAAHTLPAAEKKKLGDIDEVMQDLLTVPRKFKTLTGGK